MEGFALVGMDYHQWGLLTMGKPEEATAYARRERENINVVLKELNKLTPIDTKRVYVSGFSKGGWLSSMLLSTFPDAFAGAIILGAGRIPVQAPEPSAAPYHRKPVFIGVGFDDPNYRHSVFGRGIYQKLGARVTWREWPGLAHRYQHHDDALPYWLLWERAQPDEEITRKLIEAWQPQWQKRLDAALAQPTPLARYLALHDLKNHPLSRASTPEDRARFTQQLKEALTDPAVKTEHEVRKRYTQLVMKEMAIKRLADLEWVVAEYARLKKAPHPTTLDVKIDAGYRLAKEALDKSGRVVSRQGGSGSAKPLLNRGGRTIPGPPKINRR